MYWLIGELAEAFGWRPRLNARVFEAAVLGAVVLAATEGEAAAAGAATGDAAGDAAAAAGTSGEVGVGGGGVGAGAGAGAGVDGAAAGGGAAGGLAHDAPRGTAERLATAHSRRNTRRCTVIRLPARQSWPFIVITLTMVNSVAVLYAGSLSRLMDATIGPAFTRATDIDYTGEDGLGGAVALAEAILDRRRTPDVFLPADGAQVSRLIMPPAANFATWFVPFARTAKVLAYSPRSRFFDDFERARRGEIAWFDVLQRPGLRFGRSDPDKDPGGYTALFTLQLAETFYGVPGLKQRVLGPDLNPDQMPAVDVLRRGLESGELDATLAYRNGVADRDVPYIELPPEVDLSAPELAAHYATATYVTSNGRSLRGGPLYYTATVLGNAANPRAGAAFVAFLLSPEARELLLRHGFLATPATLEGALDDVPDAVRQASWYNQRVATHTETGQAQ
jgi:molybdate/tungstate transport system substrate-binding protein